MVAIFETPYQAQCRFAEGVLEQHSKRLSAAVSLDPLLHDAPPKNLAGGGGGRPCSQPWHDIHAAVEHLGIAL